MSTRVGRRQTSPAPWSVTVTPPNANTTTVVATSQIAKAPPPPTTTSSSRVRTLRASTPRALRPPTSSSSSSSSSSSNKDSAKKDPAKSAKEPLMIKVAEEIDATTCFCEEGKLYVKYVKYQRMSPLQMEASLAQARCSEVIPLADALFCSIMGMGHVNNTSSTTSPDARVESILSEVREDLTQLRDSLQQEYGAIYTSRIVGDDPIFSRCLTSFRSLNRLFKRLVPYQQTLFCVSFQVLLERNIHTIPYPDMSSANLLLKRYAISILLAKVGDALPPSS